MTKFHWLHLLRQGHLAAAHPRSAWPSARLFVDPAIGVVMLQIVGTVTHNFLLKRRREGKQTPASLLLSCLVCKHQAALSQERDVSLMHSSWSSFQSTNILITKLHGAWQLCWQHQLPCGFQRHLWLKLLMVLVCKTFYTHSSLKTFRKKSHCFQSRKGEREV